MRRLIPERVRRALTSLIGHAVLKLIDDKTMIQQLQVALLDGEVKSHINAYQSYGLSVVPLPGAAGLVIFQAGNRDHGTVIAAEDPRYRPRGQQAGDVALYHFLDGDPEAAPAEAGFRITLTEEDGQRVVHLRADKLHVKTTEILEQCESYRIECSDFTLECDDFALAAGSHVQIDTPSMDIDQS